MVHLIKPLSRKSFYLHKLAKLHKLLRYAISKRKPQQRIDSLQGEIRLTQDLLNMEYGKKKEMVTSFSWVTQNKSNHI